jgi:histone H3/H4
MSDMLVIVSKIKKHVKDNHELRTSEEVLTALSTMVSEALASAAAKAKADKRKTIAARDLA